MGKKDVLLCAGKYETLHLPSQASAFYHRLFSVAILPDFM